MLVRSCTLSFPILLHWFHYSNESYNQFITQLSCFSQNISYMFYETNLNPNDFRSYRWISNLSVLSKLTERIILLTIAHRISFLIVSCLTYNQLIENFIPLKRLSCMYKLAFLFHFMLIILALFFPWSFCC